jgi:hypothetical protein
MMGDNGRKLELSKVGTVLPMAFHCYFFREGRGLLGALFINF